MPQIPSQIKVLVAEVDGVDLSQATERLLTKDDLAFGETGDSQKYFESGGNVTAVNFYRGPVQTDDNRKARVDITYSGGNPTVESWKYYEADGTTIKRTITITHTWSGSMLEKSVEVVS